MQKIATRVFIISSIVFGLLGIVMVLLPQGSYLNQNIFYIITQKLFIISVFFVLPSFAIAVASKFLNTKQ